ncbi:phage tail domain-containing protein [Rossellomorea sp. RS05]|uniref:phage tail domain-containing protein n=1 Tax=Rossellomorea sp. RS05 TaxID=3149166 RepID=UPI003221C247
MFTLDKRPLKDFGIEVINFGSLPLFPEVRDRTITVPGRAGTYFYGTDLGAKTFTHQCGFIWADSEFELARLAREFKDFVTDAYGRPRKMLLIYDHEPDKYYEVRLTGDHSMEKAWSLGYFTLNMVADNPMAKSVFTSNQITLGSDVPIMSDILLGTGESSRKVFREGSFIVTNSGSSAVRLSCVISGSGNSVALEANGRRFTLGSFTNKTIAIDGENYLVKVDGVADLTNTGGHFIDLLPGENEIYVSGSSLNLTISDSLRYDYV